MLLALESHIFPKSWKASDHHSKESVQMLLVDDYGTQGGGLLRVARDVSQRLREQVVSGFAINFRSGPRKWECEDLPASPHPPQDTIAGLSVGDSASPSPPCSTG